MQDPQAQNKKIVIVVSEFNKTIIERLLQGAVSALYHFGGTNENLIIYRVPGAFEIPGTISQVLKHDRPDAIIALGAVIRGETPHFDIIAAESANGLSELSRNNDIPIINGIMQWMPPLRSFLFIEIFKIILSEIILFILLNCKCLLSI